MWKVLYFICVSAVLIPAALLEFRYFIVPFLILALQIKPDSYLRTCGDLVVYGAINIVTIYIFTFRPFTWFDGEIARFMW